jgi:hypothetical protein
MLIFSNTSNANTFHIFFIDNWLNQFSFSYVILKFQKALDVKNTNDNYFHLLLF